MYLALISVIFFCGGEHTLGYLFIKALKLNKKFADEKIQNFDNFSGFCSPEFDLFVKDLDIFQLKCNEQRSSSPRSQIRTHKQRFHNEIKLDLQTYPKPSISLSKKN